MPVEVVPLDILEFLRELCRTAAVRGYEEPSCAALGCRWGPWLDETRTTRLGSFVGLARGRGPEPRPRFAAVAHLDAVGFVVTRVEDGGFLRLAKVGGVDRRLLLGQEVEVLSPGGPLPGVIGAKPPHLSSGEERKRVVPVDELYVDLGLDPAVVRERVPPGTPVHYRRQVLALRNGRVSGTYLDDAAGLAALAVALEELRSLEHEADFIVIGSAGEEAGRFAGAVTAASDVRPHAAVAVDVTFGSYPGQGDPTGTFPLGGGPAIGLGPNCHPVLTRLFRTVADEAGIPYGLEVMPGSSGTDAWGVQTVRGGIPTAVLSVPLRYMHTPVETVSLDDIRLAGHLLAQVVRRVDWAFVEGLSCFD
ncbi:MAG: M20/M25/M40 family metallo-hydrolase [Firmicutes bacterium]|nr:M20/M25/M40 family metallo-hydrolase [Bacillota bacterium]